MKNCLLFLCIPKSLLLGNNRTKSVLVGLQGVVKKAVGLGGWHWLVLKNGVEVKLQRNALSVLEPTTGNEEDGDYDFDDSSSGSDTREKDNNRFCKYPLLIATGIEFSKFSKARVRYARPWIPSASTKSISRNSGREVQSNSHAPQQHHGMIMEKLGPGSLWRYCQSFKLANINSNLTMEQLVNVVQHHFFSQQVNEVQVVVEFVRAEKRLRAVDAH